MRAVVRDQGAGKAKGYRLKEKKKVSSHYIVKFPTSTTPRNKAVI